MTERIEDIIRTLARRIDEEKRLADKRAKQLYLADKCARAYLGTDQNNITSGVWTKALLDTETYDPGSNFDLINHRFVAPVSGYYMVTAQILWNRAVSGASYLAGLWVNGGSNTYNRSAVMPSGWISVPVSDILYMGANQYVELCAYAGDTGNASDLIAGSVETFMAVHLISTG